MFKKSWLHESRLGQWATKRPVVATAAVGAAAWFFGAELLAAALVGGAVTMLLQKVKSGFAAEESPAVPDAPH